MKKTLLIIVAIIALSVLHVATVSAQSANQPTLDPWKVTSGKIVPRNASNTVQLPYLLSATCIGTNGSGTIIDNTGSCGGGGGGTTTINGITTSTFSITASSTAGLHVNTSSPNIINVYQDKATVFVPGYLDPVDFTTFNNKPNGSGTAGTLAYWNTSSLLDAAPTGTPGYCLVASTSVSGIEWITCPSGAGGGNFNATGTADQLLIFNGTNSGYGTSTLTFTPSILTLGGIATTTFKGDGTTSTIGGTFQVDGDALLQGVVYIPQGLVIDGNNIIFLNAAANSYLIGDESSDGAYVYGEANGVLAFQPVGSTNRLLHNFNGITADRTATWPDKSGTVAFTSDLGGSATTTITTGATTLNGPNFTFYAVATTSDYSYSASGTAGLIFNYLPSSTYAKAANNGSDFAATSTVRTNLGFRATSSLALADANGIQSSFAGSSCAGFVISISATGTVQCLATSTIVSGYSTSTGANPTATADITAVNGTANTFMRSDAAPAIAQKFASSSITLNLKNATTTTSTVNPVLYVSDVKDFARTVTSISCIEVSGTTTLQVYKTTGISSLTNLSNIVGSLVCGAAVNTTTTFTTSTIAANERLMIIPTSTNAGTPQQTTISINMYKS